MRDDKPGCVIPLRPLGSDFVPRHRAGRATHLPAFEALRLFARALFGVAMEVHRENGRIIDAAGREELHLRLAAQSHGQPEGPRRGTGRPHGPNLDREGQNMTEPTEGGHGRCAA